MYSKCVQPKLILIGQVVKLVGKWPMTDFYLYPAYLYMYIHTHAVYVVT